MELSTRSKGFVGYKKKGVTYYGPRSVTTDEDDILKLENVPEGKLRIKPIVSKVNFEQLQQNKKREHFLT